MIDCAVCFESYSDARKPACYPCGHIFCLPCIEKLTSLKCPTCHQQVARSGRRDIDVVTRLYFDFNGGAQNQADLKQRVKHLNNQVKRLQQDQISVKNTHASERRVDAKRIADLETKLGAGEAEVETLKRNAERIIPAVKLAGDYFQSFVAEFGRHMGSSTADPLSNKAAPFVDEVGGQSEEEEEEEELEFVSFRRGPPKKAEPQWTVVGQAGSEAIAGPSREMGKRPIVVSSDEEDSLGPFSKAKKRKLPTRLQPYQEFSPLGFHSFYSIQKDIEFDFDYDAPSFT